VETHRIERQHVDRNATRSVLLGAVSVSVRRVSTSDDRPVLVAYDGSAEAQAAVREAAALFGGRRLLIATVWEPALAAVAFTPPPGDMWPSSLVPDPAEVAALEKAEQRHATEGAEAGAALARELGAPAEPVAVPDETDVAKTLATLADQHDACAVVVGSRGLGGVKRHLLGSTTQRLLRHTERSVLVVRSSE
jgi:nucleotide-binding universal stress UspA family protein